jgi:uncharacterized membrane protein YfcA
MLAAFGWIAAILMGVTLGLIGGGGSILTVPILVYLLGVEPVRATGYSLFVVGMTALVGATRYVRTGFVDTRATVLFGLPSLVGVYAVRRWLVPALPDPLWSRGDLVVTKGLFVMVVFAIVMALAAGSMIVSKRPEPDPAKPRTPRAVPLAMLDGVVVGSVTGFVGAGGGFLIVPALVFLLGLPVRTAIGTSLLVIAIKSLAGFVGELQETTGTDWALLGGFSLLSAGGILTGTELNQRVPAARLKPAFGWFVLAMAAVIFVQELT